MKIQTLYIRSDLQLLNHIYLVKNKILKLLIISKQ